MSKNVCCFFGHRKVELTTELKSKLYIVIENLILKENIDTFLFGSKSQFDSLCHTVVSELTTIHPHIKRVLVRSHFPDISDMYEAYLLEKYEETYFPEKISNAGKAAYVERNCEMINKSRFCIIYFDKNYSTQKSGTRLAYEYSLKKNKIIINLFEEYNK